MTKRKTKAKPATTKKQRVLELLQRPSGCTLADIVKQLKVTTIAAGSLIGDVRAMGVKVERTRSDDGASSTYHARG